MASESGKWSYTHRKERNTYKRLCSLLRNLSYVQKKIKSWTNATYTHPSGFLFQFSVFFLNESFNTRVSTNSLFPRFKNRSQKHYENAISQLSDFSICKRTQPRPKFRLTLLFLFNSIPKEQVRVSPSLLRSNSIFWSCS